MDLPHVHELSGSCDEHLHPEPTFSFTIPSIHDDTRLECRIYHPPSSMLKRLHQSVDGVAGGAILAHPYASFGGCYDDTIVMASVAELLHVGLVVGTFNFRGAGHSKGRTSWSGRPEMLDYVSFIGLVVHYLDALQIQKPSDDSIRLPDAHLERIPTGVPLAHVASSQTAHIKLILGGYSYGSIVSSHLPSIDLVVRNFDMAAEGRAEAEIKLRASCLAKERKKMIQIEHERQKGSSPRITPNGTSSTGQLSMGGDESDSGSRRASRESKRSMETVRRSFDLSKKRLASRADKREIESAKKETFTTDRAPAPDVSYLLISPVLAPISNLAMMFKKYGSSGSTKLCTHSTAEEVDGRLSNHPTLAVYGSKDIFTSQSKLRTWCETLKRKSDSQFQFHEVLDAGHFWREDGAEAELRHAVRAWATQILTAP